MIEVPVHNQDGQQIGSMQVDEQLLGGEVREGLLKQAYVRSHANRRQGSAKNKTRSETSYSTKKLYRQKGTGNARRGSAGTNLMRHGGVAFARSPRSFRQDMPKKMRQLANRNAMLSKLIDQEVKVVDALGFEKPSTKAFSNLMSALQIDRTCLLALEDTRRPEAASASNLADVTLTQIDRLNAFDLLTHRYVLLEKSSLEAWLGRLAASAGNVAASQGVNA